MSSAASSKNESRQTRRKSLLRLVSRRLYSFSQRDGPVNLLLIHRKEKKKTGLAFLNQTPASFLGTAPPDWGRGGWRRINHCLFPSQQAAWKSPHASRHTQAPAAYLLLLPPYPSVFSRWPPASCLSVSCSMLMFCCPGQKGNTLHSTHTLPIGKLKPSA